MRISDWSSDVCSSDLLHAARAAAFRARAAESLAASMALRARLLHREDAALEPHLAASVAGVAGIELAVLGPGALARLALGQGRDLDPALAAGHGLLEVEFHHVAAVRPATRHRPERRLVGED